MGETVQERPVSLTWIVKSACLLNYSAENVPLKAAQWFEDMDRFLINICTLWVGMPSLSKLQLTNNNGEIYRIMIWGSRTVIAIGREGKM